MEYLKEASYEQLLEAAKADPESIDLGKSSLSCLLQIETDDACEKAVLQVPVSDIMVAVMSALLEGPAKMTRVSFLEAAMEVKVPGTLVGRFFQVEVLEGLCGKAQKCRTLKLRQLREEHATGVALATYADHQVEVPNNKSEVQLREADPGIHPLKASCLYYPLSDTFAAADMFFVIGTTLWLLQVTKHNKHDCKIGALQKLFMGTFTPTSLKKIKAIQWVVVVPNHSTASQYTKVQNVIEQWNLSEVTLNQYVCSWQD